MNGHQDQQLDLERFKQEILTEVRKELLKTKNEIIDGKFPDTIITFILTTDV